MSATPSGPTPRGSPPPARSKECARASGGGKPRGRRACSFPHMSSSSRVSLLTCSTHGQGRKRADVEANRYPREGQTRATVESSTVESSAHTPSVESSTRTRREQQELSRHTECCKHLLSLSEVIKYYTGSGGGGEMVSRENPCRNSYGLRSR
jgi:hypothetical protein